MNVFLRVWPPQPRSSRKSPEVPRRARGGREVGARIAGGSMREFMDEAALWSPYMQTYRGHTCNLRFWKKRPHTHFHASKRKPHMVPEGLGYDGCVPPLMYIYIYIYIIRIFFIWYVGQEDWESEWPLGGSRRESPRERRERRAAQRRASDTKCCT